MDVNSIIVYVACIIFLFLIGKIFILPLKSISKIIGNSILGGILIFIINVIGQLFNFHIGLNIGTALITGILGIPRSYFINYFKNVYRLILKNSKNNNIIAKKVKENLFMKYEQIEEFNKVTQTSRLYKYGENEEFKTREEALKEVEKVEQNLKTSMSLNSLYDMSKVKHIEVENTIQIVVTTKIPKLF